MNPTDPVDQWVEDQQWAAVQTLSEQCMTFGPRRRLIAATYVAVAGPVLSIDNELDELLDQGEPT